MPMLISGCSENKVREVNYIVASETRRGVNFDGMVSDFYLVKEKPADEWEWMSPYALPYFEEYETGYEYVILFRHEELKRPPGVEDFYPTRYTILKIISKEKKDSENLPDDFVP